MNDETREQLRTAIEEVIFREVGILSHVEERVIDPILALFEQTPYGLPVAEGDVVVAKTSARLDDSGWFGYVDDLRRAFPGHPIVLLSGEDALESMSVDELRDLLESLVAKATDEPVSA